jgi:hypothetical protein
MARDGRVGSGRLANLILCGIDTYSRCKSLAMTYGPLVLVHYIFSLQPVCLIWMCAILFVLFPAPDLLLAMGYNRFQLHLRNSYCGRNCHRLLIVKSWVAPVTALL